MFLLNIKSDYLLFFKISLLNLLLTVYVCNTKGDENGIVSKYSQFYLL